MTLTTAEGVEPLVARRSQHRLSAGAWRVAGARPEFSPRGGPPRRQYTRGGRDARILAAPARRRSRRRRQDGVAQRRELLDSRRAAAEFRLGRAEPRSVRAARRRPGAEPRRSSVARDRQAEAGRVAAAGECRSAGDCRAVERAVSRVERRMERAAAKFLRLARAGGNTAHARHFSRRRRLRAADRGRQRREPAARACRRAPERDVDPRGARSGTPARAVAVARRIDGAGPDRRGGRVRPRTGRDDGAEGDRVRCHRPTTR